MTKRFLAAVLCLCLALALLPKAAQAAAGTAATVVTIGADTYTYGGTPPESIPGVGWTVDFLGTETLLTLDNYTGRQISANGDLHIVVKGPNTSTVTGAEQMVLHTALYCNGNLTSPAAARWRRQALQMDVVSTVTGTSAYGTLP